MATKISLTTDISSVDMMAKYGELIKESLGSEGVYIRTKETLQELFEQGNLKDTDKANVISQVLGQLNSSLVGAAMQTALGWSAKEKELEMQRLEMEYKLGLLDAQIDTQANEAKNAIIKGAVSRAELMKNYGVTMDSNGIVTDAVTDGKVDKEMALLAQELTNKAAEKDVLDSKVKESKAAIHKMIADTYENYGYYTYAIADNGVTGVTKQSTHSTLSDNQKMVAAEQAKGYAWNAWANSVQGSASMIGTLAASDMEASAIASYAAYWTTAMNKLNGITAPSI